MAWTITERFPSWGETGAFPAAGFFYEGGDQVNEKHLDALWNGLNGLEEDVQAALSDIDSDADGVVDKADTLSAGASLDGDLLAAGGEVIWDESETYIPNARLQYDSLTVTAGDGLKDGGSVSLNGSTTINIEPADFAGDGVKDDGADNLAVEPADFAGAHLSDDGSDNLSVDDDFVLNTGDTMTGGLTLPTVTFSDSDSDTTSYSITEDTTTGDLEVRHGGTPRHELAQNGDLRIEGSFTEGAAL